MKPLDRLGCAAGTVSLRAYGRRPGRDRDAVLEVTHGHPRGGPVSKGPAERSYGRFGQAAGRLKGEACPRCSRSTSSRLLGGPLELEALVTALDYLSARVVLDDGRLVVCLQVLADEHLRAERYVHQRVSALLSAGDAGRDLVAQSEGPPASRRSAPVPDNSDRAGHERAPPMARRGARTGRCPRR